MNINDIRFLIQKNKIREALEVIIEHTTSVLWVHHHNSARQLLSRFQQYEEDKINGVADPNEFNRITLSCLELVAKLQVVKANLDELQMAFNDRLLVNNSLPFVGREKFRDLLKKALESEEPRMIFVNITGQPGLSYLEKYLNHLNKNKAFQLVSFQIRSLVESPDTFKAVSLAKHLAIALNMAVNFDEIEEDQFKFTRFSTKLQDGLRNQQLPLIFFLHDFQHFKPFPPDDLKRFLQHIIAAIQNAFPKCIFIIAGFNNEELLANWFDELQFLPYFQDCKLEPITKDNFRNCLHDIYRNYPRQIEIINEGPVTESEYVEGMLDLISRTNSTQFDLKKAALDISKDLMKLKATP